MPAGELIIDKSKFLSSVSLIFEEKIAVFNGKFR